MHNLNPDVVQRLVAAVAPPVAPQAAPKAASKVAAKSAKVKAAGSKAAVQKKPVAPRKVEILEPPAVVGVRVEDRYAPIVPAVRIGRFRGSLLSIETTQRLIETVRPSSEPLQVPISDGFDGMTTELEPPILSEELAAMPIEEITDVPLEVVERAPIEEIAIPADGGQVKPEKDELALVEVVPEPAEVVIESAVETRTEPRVEEQINIEEPVEEAVEVQLPDPETIPIMAAEQTFTSSDDLKDALEDLISQLEAPPESASIENEDAMPGADLDAPAMQITTDDVELAVQSLSAQEDEVELKPEPSQPGPSMTMADAIREGGTQGPGMSIIPDVFSATASGSEPEEEPNVFQGIEIPELTLHVSNLGNDLPIEDLPELSRLGTSPSSKILNRLMGFFKKAA